MIHDGEHTYYAYIVASRSRTLYVGFSGDLFVRVRQHREGRFEGFSNTYRCERLVWFERYQWVQQAIAREKQIKRWSRVKKIELIERVNPGWVDLAEKWGTKLEPWSGS